MVRTAPPRVVPATLAPRLRAVAGILLGGLSEPGEDSGPDPGILLDLLVRAVQSDPSHDRVWLLCTAVFGAYPTPDDVVACARYLELAPATEAGRWLLHRGAETEAALAEKQRLAAEHALRMRRAAQRAAFAARYPRVARSL